MGVLAGGTLAGARWRKRRRRHAGGDSSAKAAAGPATGAGADATPSTDPELGGAGLDPSTRR
jgi:ribosome assembly protein YihI (activator of Der GTPase)